MVRVHINAAAIFLPRSAVRRYLESCGLEGAPRVVREWFGATEATISETAQLKASSPSKARRGKPGPKPKLRTDIADKMLDDLRSGLRTPAALQGDKLLALAKQYGGCANTAKAARGEALA